MIVIRNCKTKFPTVIDSDIGEIFSATDQATPLISNPNPSSYHCQSTGLGVIPVVVVQWPGTPLYRHIKPHPLANAGIGICGKH